MNESGISLEKIQEWLVQTVSLLVEVPEEVNVESKTDEMGVLFTLKVAQKDAGKVIGKMGNTAKALRSLLRVMGMNKSARINLKIDVPELQGDGY